MGVAAVHHWVVRHFGRTGTCEDCGSSERKTEWSNVDHAYRRVRADWIERCRSCHRKADKALREALAAA